MKYDRLYLPLLRYKLANRGDMIGVILDHDIGLGQDGNPNYIEKGRISSLVRTMKSTVETRTT